MRNHQPVVTTAEHPVRTRVSNSAPAQSTPYELRLGSLCTGYGGLDLGVGQVLPVEHTWHAELDPDASTVLAARWPGVPNLGDLRTIDWSSVEPVDILTAGFPCQPVSAAGRRKGINDERWLWDDIRSAVGRMDPRPRLLVLENVPGLLTANGGHALARVVHGLASLGYVGRYRLLRAADVGAAHKRERWFCLAQLADADRSRLGADIAYARAGQPDAARRGDLTLLPTPAARLGDRWGAPNAERAQRRMYAEGRRNLEDAVALLPTPRATDGTKGGPNQRGSSGDLMLPSAVVQLLPTPTVADSRGTRNATATRAAIKPTTQLGTTLSDVAYAARWGDYAPAIATWEAVSGRPAPEPTEVGARGQQRLAPRFVEWLMGVPDGWVTDFVLPDADPRPDKLSRNAALRVLGNGVVPTQAAAAVLALADTRPYPSTGGEPA